MHGPEAHQKLAYSLYIMWLILYGPIQNSVVDMQTFTMFQKQLKKI